MFARRRTGEPQIYSIDGRRAAAIPGLESGDIPSSGAPDGDTLYCRATGRFPADLPLEFATGSRTPGRSSCPPTAPDSIRIERVFVTPDGKHYAYSFNRVTDSDLFVVTG